MGSRRYGQHCGLAHALELVGERWALLVVRELLRGPKRFTDLQRGLVRIPTNVLSSRLKELEASGILRRRALPRPASGVGYELTEYGRELDDIAVRLALWGAESLGEPEPEDTFSTDALLLALRSTFRPEAARGVRASYELRLGGVVVHVRVDEGVLEVAEGPLAEADLTLDTDPTLRRLLTGQLGPQEAIESGAVRATGDLDLLDRFVEMFHIPPVPVSWPGSPRTC